MQQLKNGILCQSRVYSLFNSTQVAKKINQGIVHINKLHRSSFLGDLVTFLFFAHFSGTTVQFSNRFVGAIKQDEEERSNGAFDGR